MKNSLKKLLAIDLVWWPINLTFGTISKIFNLLQDARNWERSATDRVEIQREGSRRLKSEHEFHRRAEHALGCKSGLVVKNGPFKGMRYPEKSSFGSTFYPKILGSYESEITEAITYAMSQTYSAIVDIGCAEGYYAVGLGMKLKTKVFAFDINADALDSCREMAKLNGVEIDFGSFCDKATLRNINIGDRSLIICDCEGYEYELIDTEIVEHLRNHDFLIETHDFIQIEITKHILDTLSKTHHCQVFESIDDIMKAYTYDFPELDSFSLEDRLRILGEGRPKIMRWVFAKSKDHAA